MKCTTFYGNSESLGVQRKRHILITIILLTQKIIVSSSLFMTLRETEHLYCLEFYNGKVSIALTLYRLNYGKVINNCFFPNFHFSIDINNMCKKNYFFFIYNKIFMFFSERTLRIRDQFCVSYS